MSSTKKEGVTIMEDLTIIEAVIKEDDDLGFASEVLRELYAALKADDDLGFDTTHQAAAAILLHPDYQERWECSPRIVAVVGRYHTGRRAR